jgi:fermentation-respiration switch protein FrsA (DUF1100 family)
VTIATIAAIVLGAYAALVGVVFGAQRQMMYFPMPGPLDPLAVGLPEMRSVALHTDDGLTLTAWYAPARGQAATLLYLHGNGGHIGHRAAKVRPYLDGGFGVLLLSYRGYGSNPGSPTEEGLYADGRAALAFLAREGVPLDKTALYGESLGSGVAVELAARMPVAALILEAPFSSIAEVAQHHYPFLPARLLVRDRYDSVAKIGRVTAPILVLHGERDRIVPPRFGRALFEAASEPKEFRAFPEGGHNDLYDVGAAQVAVGFLQLRRLGP